ncbi:hypothetical protein [Streptomyces sp. NBC_01716]|uniref:hypothetical protein n=1 Tax=Streptomyces sp. NBC_01716 TaxID=2975917 RepID=UPI002E30C12A|nr:hypothetical protein [Streptomyces sp. NBC_01716]
MNSPLPVLTRRSLLTGVGALGIGALLPVSGLAKRRPWSRLPAVKADQITPWSMEERYSYAGYAPVVEQVAAAITKSKRLAR